MHLHVAGHSSNGRLVRRKHDGNNRSAIQQLILYPCKISSVRGDVNLLECDVLHRLTSIHRIRIQFLRKLGKDHIPYVAQILGFRRSPASPPTHLARKDRWGLLFYNLQFVSSCNAKLDLLVLRPRMTVVPGQTESSSVP